jgi:LysR family positive regulator for ilvC
MDFDQLRAFKTLAAHLHFARAAGVLHASPSGLSRQIQGLERETGARLFERDTRGVALTEAGREFLKFAEESLGRRDALQLALGAAKGSFRGTLRVYASVTACYSILPPFAKALRRNHPDLLLSVETGDPDGARFALKEARVDLALAALPDDGYAGIDAFLVKRTPLVFVAGRDGAYGALGPARRAVGRLPDPKDLLTHPLILPARGLARDRFDQWSLRERLKPVLAAETSGNEAILALARLGIGLGLVPRLVLENSPFADGLTTYGAGERLGDYEIGFLMLSQRTGALGPALKAVLKTLLEKVYPKGRWVQSSHQNRALSG